MLMLKKIKYISDPLGWKKSVWSQNPYLAIILQAEMLSGCFFR